MIKQILPVPVLAEPSCSRGHGSNPSQPGEARESTKESAVPTEGKPKLLATDSRGGQNFFDDGMDLEAWLATLPRKTRFMLGLAVSAMSLRKGECRTRDDLVCFLGAAGLPISRQGIENIEHRALRKCRRSLGKIAKEHFSEH